MAGIHIAISVYTAASQVLKQDSSKIVGRARI